MEGFGVDTGTVVLCKAGREKGRFLVVVSREDGFVYLADGDERRIASPKRKNVKHIQLTNTKLDMEKMTDKSLKRSLADFNTGGVSACQKKM